MKRVASFEKVSLNQFNEDIIDCFGMYKFSEDEINKMYNDITIPTRATAGSAGYDFVCPVDVELDPGESVKFPTGIRARMNDGWVLFMVPRSGLGFKFYIRLANTVGVVDCDYYCAENEGHIMAKIRNEGEKRVVLNAGDKFCQGILLEFGITDTDNVTAKRTGGFGSTSEVKS